MGGWVLDELPAELSEQACMCQWEQGVDGDSNWRQERLCSGWKPGTGEEQMGTVDWMGSPWGQKGAEEDFVEGVEQQVLREASARQTTQNLSSFRRNVRPQEHNI